MAKKRMTTKDIDRELESLSRRLGISIGRDTNGANYHRVYVMERPGVFGRQLSPPYGMTTRETMMWIYGLRHGLDFVR